jgi:hypothetical protein
MILQGNCSKCGELVKLDIGDQTIEQVKTLLSKRETFECPGHHVELCSPYPHFWDVDKWVLVEGKAMSEEEFLADLKSNSEEVRDTNGMSGLITSFAYGFPITNDGHSWSFTHSPAGKRFYYR